MTRNGKIAHLPPEIKDQLNHRLERGDESQPILDWLNSHVDVIEVLVTEFHGVPISKQNLSEWRNGGFPEWQLRQELIGHAFILRHTDNNVRNTPGLDLESLPGALARKLVAYYAALLNPWDGEPDPSLEAKLRILRPLLRDVALLQKTVHQAADRERLMEQRSQEAIKREKDRLVHEYEVTPLARMYYEEALSKMRGGDASKELACTLANTKYDVNIPFFEADDQPPCESEGEASNVIKLGQTQSNPVKPLKLPGRNDPCLCGSNKKFKKCCLLKLTQRPASQAQSNQIQPLPAQK
jgi:hypothetical protein